MEISILKRDFVTKRLYRNADVETLLCQTLFSSSQSDGSPVSHFHWHVQIQYNYIESHPTDFDRLLKCNRHYFRIISDNTLGSQAELRKISVHCDLFTQVCIAFAIKTMASAWYLITRIRPSIKTIRFLSQTSRESPVLGSTLRNSSICQSSIVVWLPGGED